MAVKMISDILEEISNITNKKDKVNALKSHGNNNALKTVLKYAFHPNLTFDLPEGAVPYTPCTAPEQYGMLYREARKLYLFTKEDMPTLNKLKRETLFIDLLESLDPKDAQLIVAVKDKTLPYTGINAKIVKEAFPGLI